MLQGRLERVPKSRVRFVVEDCCLQLVSLRSVKDRQLLIQVQYLQ